MIQRAKVRGWLCRELKKPAPYTCNNCGHKGTDIDLWAEDDEDLLRCPICKSPDWVFN